MIVPPSPTELPLPVVLALFAWAVCMGYAALRLIISFIKDPS